MMLTGVSGLVYGPVPYRVCSRCGTVAPPGMSSQKETKADYEAGRYINFPYSTGGSRLTHVVPGVVRQPPEFCRV
jgi:hypothetical protein